MSVRLLTCIPIKTCTPRSVTSKGMCDLALYVLNNVKTENNYSSSTPTVIV